MSDPAARADRFVGVHPVPPGGIAPVWNVVDVAELAGPPRRPARRAWYLLFVLPVALALAPPLYNRIEPALFGIPFFYWAQLALVPLSIVVVTVVHLATKAGR